MSTMKHTPGPWRVHRVDKNTLNVTSDSGAILTIQHNGKAIEEHTANAELIKEAPTMAATIEGHKEELIKVRGELDIVLTDANTTVRRLTKERDELRQQIENCKVNFSNAADQSKKELDFIRKERDEWKRSAKEWDDLYSTVKVRNAELKSDYDKSLTILGDVTKRYQQGREELLQALKHVINAHAPEVGLTGADLEYIQETIDKADASGGKDYHDKVEELTADNWKLLQALKGLYRSFEHAPDNERGNKAKTEIIKFNGDTARALNVARETIAHAETPTP